MCKHECNLNEIIENHASENQEVFIFIQARNSVASRELSSLMPS